MQLLTVFLHLVGVSLALGMILLTDARLLARVVGYRVVIPPPSRFETRVITAALVLLTLTGLALIAYGLAARPDYLANPKLQVKLVLVATLAVNAVVLHRVVFPLLERARPVSRWTSASRWRVALSVGLSNSLWFYCAFLGIARPWNFTLPFWQVFVVAPVLWLLLTLAIRFTLTLAARDEPSGEGDWIDSMKATLSGLTTTSELGDFQHDFERSGARQKQAPAKRARDPIPR
jgi:hypothetical protein